MTEREILLLGEFKEKINKLINLNVRLKSENSLLVGKLSEAKEQTDLLILQNEILVKKYDNLKLAKSLTGADDSRIAKLKIKKIVREIDQCIAMLNK